MADSSPSIASRTATGASWVIIWRMSTRLLGMVSTLVLVRLLAPADFGLVALATSFSQALDWLSSIGVREALIRESHLDRSLYDTGFTLNLLRGLAMTVLLLLGAGPVAAFFGDPRLAHILLVLALVSFMAQIENIGTVDFRRQLSFNWEFRLLVIPRIAGIVASISGAIVFANFWALIAGILTNATLRLVLSYVMHPYRPSLSLAAWRQIIGFSLWTWLSGSVQVVRDRIDALVIGRWFGPTAVGVYAVGWEIGSLPSTEVVEPVTAALFPGFAEARRSGSSSIRDGYLRAIAATFLLTLPMGFGLSLVAAPVITLGFGERWVAAVPLVHVVALVSMAKVVAYVSATLLTADGMVNRVFRILLASLIVRLVLLFALIGRFGLMGAVAAAAGSIAVEEVLYLRATFRRFDLRLADLLHVTWRSMAATAAMAAVLVATGIGWGPAASGTAPLFRDLGIAVGLGAFVYCVVLLLLWQLSGRPRGAETTLLDFIAPLIRRLR